MPLVEVPRDLRDALVKVVNADSVVLGGELVVTDPRGRIVFCQYDQRHNTIQPEDLHEAAAKLQKYTTNTVITLATPPSSVQATSNCNSTSGRSAAR